VLISNKPSLIFQTDEFIDLFSSLRACACGNPIQFHIQHDSKIKQIVAEDFAYIYTWFAWMQQKEWGEEGGVHPGATTSGEQPPRRRRGDSVWSLGVEEIRPEAYQGFALPKVFFWQL
jgi:hypothetical protein